MLFCKNGRKMEAKRRQKAPKANPREQKRSQNGPKRSKKSPKGRQGSLFARSRLRRLRLGAAPEILGGHFCTTLAILGAIWDPAGRQRGSQKTIQKDVQNLSKKGPKMVQKSNHFWGSKMDVSLETSLKKL